MARTHRRPVEDFSAIFFAISRQTKEPIILVGGHAVNAWALAYGDRIGQALKPHRPLTSADVDVVATRNGLLALYHELGGKLLLSGPREVTDGALILGVEPDTRELDVLRSVNGIPKVTAQDAILLQVCGHSVPVLFPHLLLKGKLRNALHLNQDERQDVKHIEILLLVLREFLVEVVTTASPSNEKAALGLMQRTLAVLTSDDANSFRRKFPNLSLGGVMPVDALLNSTLPKLVSFGRNQLACDSLPTSRSF
jgi:hypothetical protein